MNLGAGNSVLTHNGNANIMAHGVAIYGRRLATRKGGDAYDGFWGYNTNDCFFGSGAKAYWLHKQTKIAAHV